MMRETVSILVAEDDEDDVLFLTRAFKQVGLTNPVQFVADGQAAIEHLQQVCAAGQNRLPGLIVLDLKMPRRDGLEVLQWLREQPVLRSVPVIVFTSSANRHDIERCYDCGANAFMIKPPSLTARAEFATFVKDWLRLVQPPLASVEGFKVAQTERAAV